MLLKNISTQVLSKWHHYLPGLLILSSLMALGSAYTSQYFFGAEPCILCLYQRVPYAAGGIIGLITLFVIKGKTPRISLFGLASLIMLIGTGIAFYHVGVEQHWWVTSCSGTLATNLSIADLQQSLTQKAPKACDELDWTLFGISMATYNVFVSAALAVIIMVGINKLSKSE